MKSIINYSLLLALIIPTSIVPTYRNGYETGDVAIESPDYTFEPQFRALFFKPAASNMYYAVEAFPFNTTLATPNISPHWNIYDLHPNYHFGFDLGLRTIIHRRQSSLYANWQHFQSTTSARTVLVGTVESPAPMIGPFSSIGPDAAPYNIEAQGCVAFNFNEANLRYGQYLVFGDYLETNFFGGISFADIKQCVRATYIGTGEVSRTITVPSSFLGAGPQFGIDFTYDIARGLNLTGQVTGALLMGRGKNHTNYSSYSPLLVSGGDPSPNLQNTCVQNSTKIVPSLSERLGMAYFFPLCDSWLAQFEVGFEAKMFLNAFESTNLASGVIDVEPYDNTGGVFARTFERTISNFSLSGPYIGFNVAF